jgi:pyruvate dehydrogenase (quinone)
MAALSRGAIVGLGRPNGLAHFLFSRDLDEDCQTRRRHAGRNIRACHSFNNNWLQHASPLARGFAMAQTVGDFLIARLHAWGTRKMFGYPGDGINGVFGALNRANGKVEFIQARHEEMAAFMASAYAKFTGELGVCIATSGPGASHLVTGLYDARLDHMPVLAIAGQQSRNAIGGHYQQEVDLPSLFKDVAGAFVEQASTPAQVRHLVDRAVRIALGERRVTAIILPNDLQEQPYQEPPRRHGTVHSGVGFSKPKTLPYDRDLRRAADVLNSGRKVAILVGAGALHATDEVIAVANKLQAGAAKALLGKAALPDDLPWVTGSIGLLGTEPSYKMMLECDTLLMVGSGFPYSEFLPKEGQARGVQIDIAPDMLSLRYPMEVNLVGDAAETLRELLPLLKSRKGDGHWRRTIEKNVEDWWKTLDDRAMVDAEPVNPQRVTWELSPRLPDRVILTSDSGSCANWYARDLKIRRDMMASLSGGLASMGAAVPYAIAAKFAHPERPVIALVGDGAMQMNNMAELITVSKYWRRWIDHRWIVCVFNNEDLNQVTWEQRVMEGDPKFNASQQIPNVPYHQFAELIGLKGIYVDRPDAIGAAWEAALAADRPVVLEVKTDPEVPPLPPHISLEQARHLTEALVKGDPNERGVIRETAKQVLASIVPGK